MIYECAECHEPIFAPDMQTIADNGGAVHRLANGCRRVVCTRCMELSELLEDSE